MKKFGILIASILAFTFIFSGCKMNDKEFTKNEELIVDFANKKIEEIYNVKIDRSLFDYSLGKQAGENIFERIGDNETPEIIAVSARRFNEGKVGEVSGFSIIYNNNTKEVISSHIEKF